MRSGSRNFSNNKARNLGQSIRTPDIATLELIKSTQVYDNAFTVNSEDAHLYRWVNTGRKCSHLKFVATGSEDFPQEDDFEAPILILDQDDDDDPEDETLLDETLEALQEPKDICPVCFGTGYVGNYRIVNAFEIYFDQTHPHKTEGLSVEPGKPYFFSPIKDEGYIIFKEQLPAYFYEFSNLTSISRELRRHVELDRSKVEVSHDKVSWVILSDIDFAAYVLENTTVYFKFKVIEDTHGFFLRFTNGSPTIRVNFPHIPVEVEEGESDYFDSLTVSVNSGENISTKDIIKELGANRYWKVTSVEPKTGQHQDLGKDIGLRRVRAFERFALLP